MKTYRKIFTSLFIGSVFIFSCLAQNPIVPPGIYFADPAAHVWQDGKFYVYGSVDESTNYYCSHRYHVLSTSDMKQWNIHQDVFASSGKEDEVPYNDKLLFAPDCMEKDGKYYLYYCQPDREVAEGVAISDSPVGPFTFSQQINTGGYEEIDPGIFTDDDGQAYYLWGQFTLKMAKMMPDMITVDTTTIMDHVLTEEEHYFHEGAFMTKRNGIYYLVFADISRANAPTCLGYATSHNPMGPYTYRGVIIDNDNSDPAVWNNHGSMAEFNNQWYVFYHRSTHNSRMMRKPCVEPIFFREDGSIPEVEMTSQGAGAPLSATEKIEAERACLLFGNARIRLTEPGNEEVGAIHHNDRVGYKYIVFSNDIKKVNARVRASEKSSKIVLSHHMPWQSPFVTLDVPAATNNEWVEIEADLAYPIDGTYALWMKFYGDPKMELDLDWFVFE